MKKIFFTLCTVFSLFSYSSDPLSLDVLDGKSLVCFGDFILKIGGGLDSNLDIPSTYTPLLNRNIGYQGFIFNGERVEKQWISWTNQQEGGSYSFFPLKTYLDSSKGNVYMVTTQNIKFKIFNQSQQQIYYMLDRKNLNLHQGWMADWSTNKINYNKETINCVLAKDRKKYNKFMKNMQIRYQETIDTYKLERRKKQIEEMKDNQI